MLVAERVSTSGFGAHWYLLCSHRFKSAPVAYDEIFLFRRRKSVISDDKNKRILTFGC